MKWHEVGVCRTTRGSSGSKAACAARMFNTFKFLTPPYPLLSGPRHGHGLRSATAPQRTARPEAKVAAALMGTTPLANGNRGQWRFCRITSKCSQTLTKLSPRLGATHNQQHIHTGQHSTTQHNSRRPLTPARDTQKMTPKETKTSTTLMPPSTSTITRRGTSS
eukprot:scaffold95058_cov30-Tisochrysis_lutea.AAC.2